MKQVRQDLTSDLELEEEHEVSLIGSHEGMWVGGEVDPRIISLRRECTFLNQQIEEAKGDSQSSQSSR